MKDDDGNDKPVHVTPGDLMDLNTKIRELFAWNDLNYLSAMVTAAQVQLAGGHDYDAWDIAAWYAHTTGRGVTAISTELYNLWQDATDGCGYVIR